MNRIQVLILFLAAVGCLTACANRMPPASSMVSPSESVSQMQSEAPSWEHSAEMCIRDSPEDLYADYPVFKGLFTRLIELASKE